MKHVYFLIFLPLLLWIGTGCGKDSSIETPDEPDVPVTPVTVTLELSDADLVFDAEGGQKTFTITSNAEWTITNESEWCTTDVTSGTGNRTVTVTSQTYGELEDRNMNLTVKAGDKTQVLGVTQKGKDAIIPDKAKFEVPQGGGDLAIKVRSNVRYEVVIPEFCNSWIQPAPETRSEVSDTTYRFLIAENEEDDSRTGFIVFSAASFQDTVRIFQAQKDRLVLTQTKYNLPAKDTMITVELKTNVDYEVSIVGDDISWISRVETRASRVDRLLFHIDENTSGVLRSAKIAVQDKNGTLSDTVYVRQSPENTLVLSEKEFEVAAEGETISVELTTNIEYDVVIPDSVSGWISCPPETRTLRTDILKFLIAENDRPDERWAVVIVKDRNSGLTDTLRIRQLSNDTDITDKFDPEFAKVLQEKGYIPDATHITLGEVNKITDLSIYSDTEDTPLPLTSLRGIEYFTALTELGIYTTSLTSLDVSNNTALTKLYCNYNTQLTTLDVSGCAALEYLQCCNNTQLTSLNISGCTALTFLHSYDTPLTSLNVSNCTALTQLVCANNQFTTLDVSNNTALTELQCDNNQLTVLDVSKNTALTRLQCGNTQLTSLNVSGCTALTSLYCNKNQLTSLDVSSCTALTNLYCVDNQLTSLDVSKNTALTRLDCGGNQLTSLDVSKNTALTNLNCVYNPLMSLDVSKNTALTNLNCVYNPLMSLDVSACTALTELQCGYSQLTSLNVSGCTALTGLAFTDTQLTSLDVSSCTALTTLWCLRNQLMSLNVSGCTSLTELHSDDNQLTSLDVSSCTALTELWCSNNQLSSLDVSNNTALTNLSCGGNQLSSLDVSKNTSLTNLGCSNNQLSSLDVSKNTSLTNLGCFNNQLSSLDVSKNTALTRLDCEENQLTSLDVSGCTALTYLACYNNQLTLLEVNSCTALNSLTCENNQLTSLDVSNNTALEMLLCETNPGDGTIFPLTVWSGESYNSADLPYRKQWTYNGNSITIQLIKK
ncbi:BACON domain-containing protein [Odoribacter lunatus]|uniref:BACON domain-containing protein n=1 Tax=Odoribacter lunatus TaxID=2941335 RepID=UPI00204070F4|nr:BACON domain-containing carbohydrate-binding protein [Odoribacter lunatus]